MIYVINWFVNILTLGLVSIATITTTTYHVDEPITELNNQSLNDVFLDGNIMSLPIIDNDLNGLPDGLTMGNLNNYNVSDNIFYTETTGVNGAKLIEFISVLQNHSYYYNVQYKTNDSPRILLYDGVVSRYSNGSFINDELIHNYSEIETVTNTGTGQFQPIRWTTTPNSNAYVYLYSYYLIDLTDLGIDNLTHSQLDDWYDIYVQANANNGVYIESTSHLNNNIHLVDVSVMVISFGFWVWLFKFLKGVIF